MSNHTIAIETEITITNERIFDLVITAFEGGIDYWGWVSKVNLGPFESTGLPDSERDYKSKWAILSTGGWVEITDAEDDDEVHRLDLDKFKAGLAKLASKHPKIFARIMEEQDDASDADVLIQMALFGEEVYA